MNVASDEAEAADYCAFCGIAAIDEIKLKPCPHCDLSKYCSEKCQQEHREKHEKACKMRAAELYDEILFKQPESSCFGDCPICCLPMPLYDNKIMAKACCSKQLCIGCVHANLLREKKARLKVRRCPFCRHPFPKTGEETEKLRMERVKLNDPIAIGSLGLTYHGKGDEVSAFKCLNKAAELGHVDSIYNLSVLYGEGEGVEEDKDKQRALLEKAAIAGHPNARFNLGHIEADSGRIDRAVLHWIIAAKLGHDKSTKRLKNCYKDGNISKDDFAVALRAHQAAVDATKSPQREAVDALYH